MKIRTVKALKERIEMLNKEAEAKQLPYRFTTSFLEKYSSLSRKLVKKQTRMQVLKKILKDIYTFGEGVEYKKQKEKTATKVFETESYKIAFVKEEGIIGCHPSPEDFRPKIRKFKNNILIYTVFFDRYKSNKHNNEVFMNIAEVKEINGSLYILLTYSLYRSNLTFGRHKYFNYLVGVDDGSTFITRISPEIDTIEEALEWLKPAEVRKAEEKGRKVFRQGDVFFVEMKKGSIFNYSLPLNHKIVKKGNEIFIIHNEHSTLHLPHERFKPVVRKEIAGGRVGRWAD